MLADEAIEPAQKLSWPSCSSTTTRGDGRAQEGVRGVLAEQAVPTDHEVGPAEITQADRWRELDGIHGRRGGPARREGEHQCPPRAARRSRQSARRPALPTPQGDGASERGAR